MIIKEVIGTEEAQWSNSISLRANFSFVEFETRSCAIIMGKTPSHITPGAILPEELMRPQKRKESAAVDRGERLRHHRRVARTSSRRPSLF